MKHYFIMALATFFGFASVEATRPPFHSHGQEGMRGGSQQESTLQGDSEEQDFHADMPRSRMGRERRASFNRQLRNRNRYRSHPEINGDTPERLDRDDQLMPDFQEQWYRNRWSVEPFNGEKHMIPVRQSTVAASEKDTSRRNFREK